MIKQNMDYTIRTATKEDVEFIHQMICELALYEKAPEQVKLTIEQLRYDGFERQEPLYWALIAEGEEKMAFALYYYRYSTWKGKNLYLEDLFVIPRFRSHGIGKSLLKELAKIAVREECSRYEWQVLDWNTPAIKFYETFGANLDSEWINCKLEGEQIKIFAQS